MYNKIFNVDFNRLIVSLLPTALRKPFIYALLYCLTKPILTIYNLFMQQRNTNLYLVNITPQVCRLRKLLNDTFDPDLRRIYISDGQVNEWTIVYSHLLFNPYYGKQPLWLSPNGYYLLSKQGIVSAIGFDFAVLVPLALRNNNNHNQLVSLLNTYKLASKRYIISYY